MTRRIQIAVFAVLLAILGYMVYSRTRPPAAASADDALVGFQPLSVENPSLRLDLLDRMKKYEYQGSQRNIFVATLPPPPPPPAAALPTGPVVPPPPPPLVVPATFFGYVTDARTGNRRAFFSEGDDVYILGIGETLQGRFRLLEIGNNSAEMEELTSGRRTTLTMEEPGPS
jgi:hypothetical protein